MCSVVPLNAVGSMTAGVGVDDMGVQHGNNMLAAELVR